MISAVKSDEPASIFPQRDNAIGSAAQATGKTNAEIAKKEL
jgi:hypothetical protein